VTDLPMTDETVARLDDIEIRIDIVEKTLAKIQASKPGRKGKPLLTSEIGVCGLDPTCDSATCENATIYRHQQGCRGTACVEINQRYYADYRKARRENTAEVL